MNRAFLLLIGFLVTISSPCVFAAEAPHDFGKWEKEIAAYEQSDQTNPPPKGALLFTGSSTIRRWTSMEKDLPGHRVINRGFGGCDIEDVTHFADRIIFPHEPKMVLIRAGGNDINNGKSVERVFSDYKEFVAKVHAKLPQTEIVFISQSPSVKRLSQADKENALNKQVEEYSKKNPRLKYIDVSDITLGKDGKPRPELFVEDQLHFNAEGYKLFAERVRAFLGKKP